MKSDDRALLLATHRGHDAAARVLWSRYAPELLRFAHAFLGDYAAAEDIVQSSFCRILELDRATIRAVREVRPWLFGLVRNTALTDLRTRERAARRDASSAPGSTTHFDPPPSDLILALDSLTLEQREIVLLRHVAGLTFHEAAAALHENRHTLAGRYRRALDRLRDELEPRSFPSQASVVTHA